MSCHLLAWRGHGLVRAGRLASILVSYGAGLVVMRVAFERRFIVLPIGIEPPKEGATFCQPWLLATRSAKADRARLCQGRLMRAALLLY